MYSLMMLLLFSNFNKVSVNGYELVYKKDFSEHCRYRAIPSVFLGREAMEANSQILRFSKLEVPYSCSISLRSESGTNIILVIEVSSANSVTTSCAKNPEQLLIYEMGESFGGYWGPMADTLVNQDSKNETQYYTIKTTPAFHHIDSRVLSTQMKTKKSPTKTVRKETSNANSLSENIDYITEEIPIVNVSGFLMPGAKSKLMVVADSIFNTPYDITPGGRISYDTTILPLIQFSKNNDINTRNNDFSVYPINYNTDSLPMNVRFTYPKTTTLKKRKLYRKYEYNANKLIDFKSTNNIFELPQQLAHPTKLATRLQLITSQKAKLLTKHEFIRSTFKPIDFITREKSLSRVLLEMFLNNINKTTRSAAFQESVPLDTSMLLRKISEMKHNFSVYLLPNLAAYSTYKEISEGDMHTYTARASIDFSSSKNVFTSESNELVNKLTTQMSKSQVAESALSVNLTENYSMDIKADSLQSNNITLSTNNDSLSNVFDSVINSSSIENRTDKNAFNLKEIDKNIKKPILNTTKSLRGSLVNRESWENVVQIAPVMADMLNVFNKTESVESDIKGYKYMKRRKKHINSVPIDIVRPHKTTSKEKMVSRTTDSNNLIDIQEFAEQMELQADEIHGRVSLRYIRQYVGPILYNICKKETLFRHVYLFNTSRLVLAISNFTIDKMTLIATSARTLVTAQERCASSQFECQVSGARVCIDSLNACDGVPNCDIYDEDRLMCGADIGLQHNVYLAAFTFIITLLTLFYIIQNLLKRCVPKVSEAFFIYTEGVENMLNLNTIMSNPTDVENTTKTVYPPNVLKYDVLYSAVCEENKRERFFNAIKKCFKCRCLQYKRNDKDKILSKDFSSCIPEPKNTYSFAELEIQKMIKNNHNETSVQTGESLELAHVNNNNIGTKNFQKDDNLEKLDGTDSILLLNNVQKHQQNLDELSVIKFFKERSSYLLQSNDTIRKNNESNKSAEEKEIRSHLFETKGQTIPSSISGHLILTNSDICEDKASSSQTKHLRFDQHATMIPADIIKDEDVQNVNKKNERHNDILGRSQNTSDLDDVEEEAQERGVRSNRDYIRFWSKAKRTKKPHL